MKKSPSVESLDPPVKPFSRGGNLYGYIWWLTSLIPKGRVSTYGSLARALGDPIAARAVGKGLSRNPEAPSVPCHRIVMSNGQLGGYAYGRDEKKRLLSEEGVAVNGEKVDLASSFFDVSEVVNEGPLSVVAREQTYLSSLEKYEDYAFSTFIGIDAAYLEAPSTGFELGCVSLVVEGKATIEPIRITLNVTSPYIPTYLHLREAPLIFAALLMLEKKIGKSLMDFFQEAEAVLLIDGDGFMHPRRFGLASSVGAALDLPSIGVAKSLLTGSISGDEVISNDRGRREVLGKVMSGKNPRGKIFYVSSGHGVSLGAAVETLKGGYPDVLLRAHLECKRGAR
ncbi:MAG: endonuclease V [Thermoprotei archaeon]